MKRQYWLRVAAVAVVLLTAGLLTVGSMAPQWLQQAQALWTEGGTQQQAQALWTEGGAEIRVRPPLPGEHTPSI